jgi:hypothetical protein
MAKPQDRAGRSPLTASRPDTSADYADYADSSDPVGASVSLVMNFRDSGSVSVGVRRWLILRFGFIHRLHSAASEGRNQTWAMTRQDNCHCEESDDAAISIRDPDSLRRDCFASLAMTACCTLGAGSGRFRQDDDPASLLHRLRRLFSCLRVFVFVSGSPAVSVRLCSSVVNSPGSQ